jgi:HTH-type transcriptional regulator / antitoxin HigA
MPKRCSSTSERPSQRISVRPIRTKDDYEAACGRIDEIFQAEPGSPEDDELEILVTLVEKYEEDHFPVGMPHPVGAIEIQMQSLGVSRRDLGEHLSKSSGRVSDILNCRRALTLDDIRKLSRLLHIPVAVLSREYELEKALPKELRGSTHRTATC